MKFEYELNQQEQMELQQLLAQQQTVMLGIKTWRSKAATYAATGLFFLALIETIAIGAKYSCSSAGSAMPWVYVPLILSVIILSIVQSIDRRRFWSSYVEMNGPYPVRYGIEMTNEVLALSGPRTEVRLLLTKIDRVECAERALFIQTGGSVFSISSKAFSSGADLSAFVEQLGKVRAGHL